MKSPNQKIPDRAHEVTLAEGKKAYFLSDLHLGAPVLKDNRERELQIVEWLERIRPDCGMLFLLGDIFDFWFEYKRAVPQGHVRFLAKISEFADQGIPVHFFTGNHDIWTFGYLTRECGVILHTRNEAFRINGKDFLIGHGDALNPQDRGYLWLYHIFHNHFLQRCFRWVHPDGILTWESGWHTNGPPTRGWATARLKPTVFAAKGKKKSSVSAGVSCSINISIILFSGTATCPSILPCHPTADISTRETGSAITVLPLLTGHVSFWKKSINNLTYDLCL